MEQAAAQIAFFRLYSYTVDMIGPENAKKLMTQVMANAEKSLREPKGSYDFSRGKVPIIHRNSPGYRITWFGLSELRKIGIVNAHPPAKQAPADAGGGEGPQDSK